MLAKWVEGLQLERAADEILVGRPGVAESYALNQTAGVVFDLCDGGYSKSEIATVIHDRNGLPADERVVDLALDMLVDAGLVVLDGPPPPVGTTRQALMRRLSLSGAAVALLPVVETILITPAAAAAGPQQPVPE
jgi:hypothetical protein